MNSSSISHVSNKNNVSSENENKLTNQLTCFDYIEFQSKKKSQKKLEKKLEVNQGLSDLKMKSDIFGYNINKNNEIPLYIKSLRRNIGNWDALPQTAKSGKFIRRVNSLFADNQFINDLPNVQKLEEILDPYSSREMKDAIPELIQQNKHSSFFSRSDQQIDKSSYRDILNSPSDQEINKYFRNSSNFAASSFQNVDTNLGVKSTTRTNESEESNLISNLYNDPNALQLANLFDEKIQDHKAIVDNKFSRMKKIYEIQHPFQNFTKYAGLIVFFFIRPNWCQINKNMDQNCHKDNLGTLYFRLYSKKFYINFNII